MMLKNQVYCVKSNSRVITAPRSEHSSITPWPLKMKVLRSFETSGISKPATHCNSPEDLNLQKSSWGPLEGMKYQNSASNQLITAW